MKRSQINLAVDNAQRALREHGVRLPPYAYWSPADWRKAGADYARVTRNGQRPSLFLTRRIISK